MFEINKIYTRETIGIILNTNTKGGQWATGCASFNNEFYLFITIEGPGRTGHNYNDKFLENGLLEWHGRTGSHVNWPTMQNIINNKNNIFYVDGNAGLIAIDDTTNKVTEIGQQLINKGCILLDKPYVIERNGQKLVLSQFLNKETYEKQYPETKDEDIKIIITHYPRDRRYYEEVSVGNLPDYDLVIAGHYHGGQYRIPFLGAIFIPNTNPYGTRFFPKQEEVSGLTEWGGYKQYISRGLGASGDYKILRFRLFNIPQIDVLILKNKE